MKKIFIMFLFMSFINVYADKCTYDQKVELTKLANEIKIDYDEKSKDVHVSDEFYEYDTKDVWVELSIYNIPKDFVLEISNDYNKDVISAYSSNIKEGIYTFKDYNYYKIINYSIKVINTSTCDRYTVKTIRYKKPMFNPNYTYDVCKENEDVPFCNKYITSDKKIYKMGVGLQEAIISYKQTAEEKFENNDKNNWFLNNYIYIIGGIVIVGVLAVGVVYINKKRSEI